MIVQIRMSDGNGQDLAALADWLQDEAELRGRVGAVHGTVGEHDLGPVLELLTVAVGTGGAGTVLASSLRTWLLTRKTTAKITVETEQRSVTVDIQTVREVMPLLERILKADHDD
jgi:hypothetical protein